MKVIRLQHFDFPSKLAGIQRTSKPLKSFVYQDLRILSSVRLIKRLNKFSLLMCQTKQLTVCNVIKHTWAALWQNQQCGCAPSEDSDQPGHPPSLIRVFAVRMKKAWVLSYLLSAQRRIWSDWADAQADLSLHWAHSHLVGFVMRRLSFSCGNIIVTMPGLWFDDISIFLHWFRKQQTP